jgi:hypothetical protein
MNSLTPQIPLKNETKNITNLRNVNLGKLLPINKSFFSTLINTNSIQYISMTRIIDIPQTFLDTLISRVLNGPDDYASKVNKYTQQIPTNPPGTIIFYTENIKPINSDQAIVCNANCDQVVGSASLLQPEFGTSTTVSRASTTSSRTTTTTLAKVPAEECEEEFIYPGSKTAVNVIGGSSSTSETSKSTIQGSVIGLFIVLIIVFTLAIFFFLTRATNVSFPREIFSQQLWANPANIPWIIVTFIGFLTLTSCFIAALFKINEEISSKDTSEHNIKIRSWELFLIGSCIWLVCIIILFLQSKYSFGNSSKYERFNSLSSNSSAFTAYGSSSSSERNNLLEALRKYNSLSPSEQANFIKNNPQLASLLASKSSINDLIQSLKNSSTVITPKIKAGYNSLLILDPKNQTLKDIKNNMNLGSPVPPGLRSYIDSKKAALISQL